MSDRLRRLLAGPGRGDEPVTSVSPAASTGGADTEERVKELARGLFARHGLDEDALPADDDFAEAVSLLAAPGVPFDVVAAIARDPWGIPLRAIGLAASAERRDAPPDWVEWALGRLHRAHTMELAFLLYAVEANAAEPVVARVLARADYDWCYDPNLGRLTEFVRRRLASGEAVEPDQFDDVDRSNVEQLADAVVALTGAVPPEVVAAYERWRDTRVDVAFLREFAAVWELPPAGDRPALVGDRGLIVSALVDALAASPRRSALLVGEHGVGKTTLLREALRELDTSGWVVFEASAAAVLAGQAYVGQLEGRVQHIVTQARGRPVLWVLPSFGETLHAGQHSRSPQGLLDALLPHVEAGELTIVGELDPAALERLLKERPRVASAFTAIRVEAPGETNTLAVARAWADDAGLELAAPVLTEAYELADHYLAGIAMPGALLRLLRAARGRLADDGASSPVALDSQTIVDTLSDATGLPLRMLDPRSALDLGEVRAFLEGRVLGQPEAVECLVERIALIKAGLNDPTRPLGVFLFVGPTGTGKTELAKSLAHYVFGSPERLVRLDMSEFQTPESLERLLADRASEPQAALLIAAVRREPFSVVLLDEFEKAHPNLWDVFLALFDDGRLTDRSGRTTDFRHCIVILTSNVGSALAAGPAPGFAREPTTFQPAAVERAVTQAFRPELLNRLDRVVVFRPLEREQMRTLLEHELQAVLERRGLRSRGWAVEWDEAALDVLLEQGFSRELGARPLKRAVERLVLAPLARAIVGRTVPEGDQFLFITTRRGAIEVTFIDPDAGEAEEPPTQRDTASELSVEQLVADPRGDRGAVTLLGSELDRLEQTGWRLRKEELLAWTRDEGFWDGDARHDVLATIEALDRLDALTRTAAGLLARLQTGRGRPPADLVGLLAERVYLLDRALVDLDAGRTGDAFAWVRPSPTGDAEASAEFAAELGAMLEAWAERRGMRWQALPGGVLAISGLGAHAILASESGLHVLEEPGEHERSFDRVSTRITIVPWAPGAPSDEDGLTAAARVALAEGVDPPQIVRRYRREPSPLVRDTARGRTGRLDRVLGGEFDVVP